MSPVLFISREIETGILGQKLVCLCTLGAVLIKTITEGVVALSAKRIRIKMGLFTGTGG